MLEKRKKYVKATTSNYKSHNLIRELIQHRAL